MLNRFIGTEELLFQITDRAFEGDRLRKKAVEGGLRPVVFPDISGKQPREYVEQCRRQRNGIEHCLLLPGRCRTVFSGFLSSAFRIMDSSALL